MTGCRKGDWNSAQYWTNCARNLPKRKKGQKEGNVLKDQGGGKLLKIMVVENINLPFVKTTV